MRAQLDLNIDEITLEGFPNVDRNSLALSIESELTRLLKSQDLPPAFSAALSTRKLDFGHFDLPPNSGPKLIGRHIAKTIYSGFVKQGGAKAVLKPGTNGDVKRAGALSLKPYLEAKGSRPLAGKASET